MTYIYIFQKYKYQNLTKISLYVQIYCKLIIFYSQNIRDKYIDLKGICIYIYINICIYIIMIDIE